MRVACAWTTVTAVACGGADADRTPGAAPSTPAAVSVDSAGIEVVTVHRSEWTDGTPWTVDPAPFLDMGALDGDASQQFFRVQDIATFSDGRIVVANQGSAEVRTYSPEGELLWSVGGEGKGPGEFDALFKARVRNDTIYAHDFRVRRVTVFDEAGAFVRTITLDRSGGLPLELWVTDDGFVGLGLSFPDALNEEQTFLRRRAQYMHFRPDGSLEGVFAELRGQEVIMTGRELPGGGTVVATTTPLISNQQQQAVVEGRLVAAETDRYSVNVFDTGGSLERIIRVPSRERGVSPEEWQAALDERLERAETPGAVRNMYEQADLKPAPELRPNFGRFIEDSEGYVWIAPYRPERDQPTPYTVLDPDGGLLGEVALPYGFVPREIGADFVLGTWRDELDVTHVRGYRLTR